MVWCDRFKLYEFKIQIHSIGSNKRVDGWIVVNGSTVDELACRWMAVDGFVWIGWLRPSNDSFLLVMSSSFQHFELFLLCSSTVFFWCLLWISYLLFSGKSWRMHLKMISIAFSTSRTPAITWSKETENWNWTEKGKANLELSIFMFIMLDCMLIWFCIHVGQIKRIKEKFRVMNEKLNSREFAQNLNPPSLQ